MSGEPLRVLLVEDDVVSALLTREVLRREGAVVQHIENGAEAVARLQGERFDLVLMDLNLPQMNGVEATRSIRAFEEATGRAAVLIVGLTGSVRKEEEVAGRAAGMNAWLSKPLRPGQLGQVLAELVTRVVPGEGLPVRLRRRLAELYRQAGPGLLEAVRAPLAAGEAELVARAAHRLAGALGNFPVLTAHQAARRLERCAREGDLGGAWEVLPELERACLELESVLSSWAGELAETPPARLGEERAKGGHPISGEQRSPP